MKSSKIKMTAVFLAAALITYGFNVCRMRRSAV